MLIRRFLALWWILIALTAVPAFSKDKWIEVTSPHFVAIGNAGERQCRKTVEELEQFRHAFSKIFSLGTDEVPTRVMIFRNDRDFKPFQPLYEGKPRNVPGYFQKGQGLNIIALDGSARNSLHLIYHEYVHLLVGRYPRPLPVWFNEGFAEFYSTFRTTGDKAMIGEPISEHIHWLRERGTLPLETLLQVNHSSPEYNENSKTGVFYAESWALVHYLMLGEDGSRRPRLGQYIQALSSGAEPLPAFKAAFETPLEEMEKELRRYINQKSVNIVIYKLEDLKAARDVSISPVSESDAQAYLGELLLQTNDLEAAPAYFNKALEIEPGNARALEGLGLLALEKGEDEKAMEFFEKIDMTQSTNFLASYHYGEALMDSAGVFSSNKVTLTDEQFERCARPLRRSVDLMPTFAEGYYLLALLDRATGRDRERGIGLIRRAIHLKPQELSYRELLANLQVENEDWAGARETVNSLDAFQTLQAQQFAQDMRDYIDYFERQAHGTQAFRQDMSDQNPDESGDRTTEAEPVAPPPRAPSTTSEVNDPKPVCKPDFVNIRGAVTVTGHLLAVECGASGVVYLAEIDGRETRFVGRDPDKPVLYSCYVDLSNLGCGPLRHPAAFHLPANLEKDSATGLNLILAIELQKEP